MLSNRVFRQYWAALSLGFLVVCTYQSALAQDFGSSVRSMFSYGINFNTRSGFMGGLAFRGSVFAKDSRYHTFALDILDIRDPKEIRSTSTVTRELFVPGKLNHFFGVRAQYGQEWLFFEPSSERGIRLSGSVLGGLSLGLIMPYIIKYDARGGGGNFVVEQYDPQKHPNFQNIQGALSPTTAINGTELAPGVSAKLALTALLGLSGRSYLGFEAGYNADLYSRKIPIMAFAPARSSFGMLYLNFFYGLSR